MIYRSEQNRIWLLISAIIIIKIFTFHESLASDNISIGDKVASDYGNFYSKKSLIRMGVCFLSMGIVANSGIDENFQDWYQDDIRNEATDDYSEIAKVFGEGKYLLPISLLTSGLYYFDQDSPVGNWGLNSVRAYAVGLPVMWVMQNVTGASRPNELSGSEWRPFNDTNGVSGHAFVGAVPFLTIARMSDSKFIKYTSYIASSFTAWSRVNDNDHFISQSILGWYMAYESVNSVFETNNKFNNFSVAPALGNNFYGIVICGSW